MFDYYVPYPLYSAYCPICKNDTISHNPLLGDAECFLCGYLPLYDCLLCGNKKTLQRECEEDINNRNRKCKICGAIEDSNKLLINQQFDIQIM